MDLALLSRLNALRAERRAAVLITDLEGGGQRLLTPDQFEGDAGRH